MKLIYISQLDTVIQIQLRNRMRVLLGVMYDFDNDTLEEHLQNAMDSKVNDILSSFDNDLLLVKILDEALSKNKNHI